MGQLQQMLLILVFIAVGVASLVAIDTFKEGRDESIRDALRQDILTAVGSAQKYYRMPPAMGGGGSSFTGITMADVELDTLNLNGTFTITGNGDTLEITGTGPNSEVQLKGTTIIGANHHISIMWEDL